WLLGRRGRFCLRRLGPGDCLTQLRRKVRRTRAPSARWFRLRRPLSHLFVTPRTFFCHPPVHGRWSLLLSFGPSRLDGLDLQPGLTTEFDIFGLTIWSAPGERDDVLSNECNSFLCAQRRPNNFVHLIPHHQ